MTKIKVIHMNITAHDGKRSFDILDTLDTEKITEYSLKTDYEVGKFELHIEGRL